MSVGSEMEKRERRRRHEEDNTRVDSSTLTVSHIGDIPDTPRPDGAILAVALAARDVAVGVRAGSAVARLPGAVGTVRAVRVTRPRRKALPARSDAPEHAASAGRAVPLQLRPGPRRKHRLRRVAQSHQQRHGHDEPPRRREARTMVLSPCPSSACLDCLQHVFVAAVAQYRVL